MLWLIFWGEAFSYLRASKNTETRDPGQSFQGSEVRVHLFAPPPPRFRGGKGELGIIDLRRITWRFMASNQRSFEFRTQKYGGSFKVGVQGSASYVAYPRKPTQASIKGSWGTPKA